MDSLYSFLFKMHHSFPFTPEWGSGGRKFKSSRSDQLILVVMDYLVRRLTSPWRKTVCHRVAFQAFGFFFQLLKAVLEGFFFHSKQHRYP